MASYSGAACGQLQRCGQETISPDFFAPIFICPFCGRPYVRMNTVSEQSADARAIPSVAITLLCEARHEVQVELSQYPDHVQISSEARAPALSARRRAHKRSLSRDTHLESAKRAEEMASAGGLRSR